MAQLLETMLLCTAYNLYYVAAHCHTTALFRNPCRPKAVIQQVQAIAFGLLPFQHTSVQTYQKTHLLKIWTTLNLGRLWLLVSLHLCVVMATDTKQLPVPAASQPVLGGCTVLR